MASALEASGQESLLEPWISNRTKSLVKSPKFYICDSGLCAFLMGLTGAADLSGSPMVGALWETLVGSELRRRRIHSFGGWELHFWRGRTNEADFLLHRGGHFDLADAKWTEHPGDRDTSMLLRVSNLLPKGSVRKHAVICRCDHPYPLPSGVRTLPLESADWLLDG